MTNRSTSSTAVTISIGLDIGDKESHLFALRPDGEVVRDRSVRTTQSALERELKRFPIGGVRVVIEAGSQSAWIGELIERCGHEAVVANPRVAVLSKKGKKRKNDRKDAEELAHWGLLDLFFLDPIQHRGLEAQADLSVLRSRDLAVRARTELINHVRSIVKVLGERLPSCDTDCFHRKVKGQIPEALQPALCPLLDVIADLTLTIKGYDKQIEKLCKERYPETEILRQIKGVGPITSLAFILILEDARRFPRSRQVGAYLGLIPALYESGTSSPQLRISKQGNEFLRRLLIQSAHFILGPFGPDCDLRRHGEKIAERGGKNAKKRAAVAVARKLSVLMHLLWKTGQVYDPLYTANRRAKHVA